MTYYGNGRRPGWSVRNRSHGYLEPNLSYLSRRHTAIAVREGMTFMDYPMLPSTAPGERQFVKPPRQEVNRMGDVLKVGDIVLHRGHTGEVRYIGHLPGSPIAEDIYLGLKFSLPVGNSDGIYNSFRIFSAHRNFAGFYKASECMYRGESAALYLPSDLTSGVDHLGRQAIYTDYGHIEVQYALHAERQFFQDYERLARQIKRTEQIRSGRAGYRVTNPMLLLHEKREPRYPNYLPELKKDRQRSRQRIEDLVYNMEEASLETTPTTPYSQLQPQPGPSRPPLNRIPVRKEPKPRAQHISQNSHVPQPPPLPKYHNYFSPELNNHVPLTQLDGKMTHLVSLFRAPPKQGYYDKSERDSATNMNDILHGKRMRNLHYIPTDGDEGLSNRIMRKLKYSTTDVNEIISGKQLRNPQLNMESSQTHLSDSYDYDYDTDYDGLQSDPWNIKLH